jgi:hypothetical protein
LFLQEQEDGAVGSGQFPYLLALHALCAADASLATPKADPQRFVRCLAPYISAAGVQQGILARTNSGEELATGVARALKEWLRLSCRPCPHSVVVILTVTFVAQHHMNACCVQTSWFSC